MPYQEIITHLVGLGNSDVAEHSQRFFKTGLGEYGFGDKFLGIRVPMIRQSVKKYRSTPVSTAVSLLKSEYHEIRLFAVLLLVLRFSSKQDNTERDEIYQLYLRNTHYVNNWDLVDSSAHHIVGAYLHDKNRSILTKLAAADLLWDRRIAMMATYYFIKNNEYEDALQIAEQLLRDKEGLIHKVTGWMLREIGNRDRSIEVEFLQQHYQAMPRTMLRYAIEKFSKEERQAYLRGDV